MRLSERESRGRWEGPILNLTGKILFFMGIILLMPALAALICSEDVVPFLVPSVICLVISVVLGLLFRSPRNIKPAEGLLMVSFTLILAILVGAVPFMMAGFPFTDAFFESASGFTTTGSTVIQDLSGMPRSILFWRSLSQWIGGIGFILIFMSVLPLLGLGGRSMTINEVSGSGSKNFSARIRDVAKQFAAIYLVLTGIMLLICVILGVSVFESICMALSTISTGGFLPVGSMASYSVAIQIVAMVFMFLGGTSFYLHYRAIYRKDFSGYLKNTEFKTMAVWFLLISMLLFAILVGSDTMSLNPEGFKDVLFTVVSLGTTTGLVTTDYGLWPFAALFLLGMVMFMGGSSGSTAGGVKIYRGVLMSKYLKVAMQKIIHPRAIFDIKIDDNSIEDNAMSSALAVVMLFCLTIVVAAAVLLIYVDDPMDSISLVLSSVTNVGPAMGGSYSPMDAFADLGGGVKIFLGILMWIGRMEIIMAIVLFTPVFWKEILRGRARHQ